MSGQGGFYSGPALRKTGAISFFAVRIDRCLRGFWRRIKEAPGISRFFGDVRESFGCRLEDSTGETAFEFNLRESFGKIMKGGFISAV